MIVIRLGIPSVDGKYSKESIVLVDKVQHEKFADIQWQYRSVADCYCNFYARNKLIYDMNNNYENFGHWTKDWQAPYDYFLSADDDTGFTVQAVRAMVSMSRSVYNNAIIAGAYVSRWNKDVIVAGQQIDSGKFHCMSLDEYKKLTTFPYQVAWAGNGMLLIPAKILNTMPIPLYQHSECETQHGERSWYHSDQALALLCVKREVPIYLSGETAIHCGVKI